jgi:hypothetical protein
MTEFEPLLVTHRHAREAIDASGSHYWALVRAGKIQKAGKGKAGRAVWKSVKAYVAELELEAEKAKEAEVQAGKAA